MTKDLSAREKFSCPACGAAAEWNPTKKELTCPYCGTGSPAKLSEDSEKIVEHDLVKALRGLQESQGGWEEQRTSVQCKACKAIMLFNPEKVATNCEFCASPTVLPYESTRHPIHPESLLPFEVGEVEIREQVHKWYKTRWFAPNKLKKRALTDTLHGMYIPYWTFDKHVFAKWTAQSGYYYYETRVVEDANGNARRQQVRKIRWQPSRGELEHFFDDELVAATQGVNPKLLGKVEPFPTAKLVPYDAGYVSGWVVEQYQIDLVKAAQTAREKITNKVTRLCAQKVPGDTHRNLRVSPTYSGETFKHILAPIWLLSYNYGRKSYQVVVNGYTGTIAGKRPYSWVKIALTALGTILAFAITFFVLVYFS